MKLILIISLVILFGLIGLGVSQSYVQRKKFFLDFNNFLISLKSDINLFSNKLPLLIKKYTENSSSKDFKALLNNYHGLLKTGMEINNENLFAGIKILNEQEKNSTILFFSRLGKLDVFNQVEEIEQYICPIKEYSTNASEEAKKYCSLYTKLGIIFGLLIAIILI